MNGTLIEHQPESSTKQSRKRRRSKRSQGDGVVEDKIVDLSGSTVNYVSHQPESSQTRSRKRKFPELAKSNGVVQPLGHASNEVSSSINTQSVPPLVDVVVHGRYFFRLFKIIGSFEEYILEQHEVETGDIDRSHLSLVQNENGEWTVVKRRVREETRDIARMVTDPLSSIFHKQCDVPLHERLEGWSMNGKMRSRKDERSRVLTDKYYYRGRTKCRSLVEVSKYILYSCTKELIRVITETRQKVQEANNDEAITIQASETVGGVNLLNPNATNPPTENPHVLAGTDMVNENHIRNDNLIAMPPAHTNFDGGVKYQNPNVNDLPIENVVVLAGNDLVNGNLLAMPLPPDNNDEVGVDDSEVFANLAEIENLHDLVDENLIAMLLPPDNNDGVPVGDLELFDVVNENHIPNDNLIAMHPTHANNFEGGVQYQNPNVDDLPVENVVVLAGNDLMNGNLIPVPLPLDNNDEVGVGDPKIYANLVDIVNLHDLVNENLIAMPLSPDDSDEDAADDLQLFDGLADIEKLEL